MFRTVAIAVLASLAAAVHGASSPVCPPPGFDALNNFNVSAYISAPWYPQLEVGTGPDRQQHSRLPASLPLRTP